MTKELLVPYQESGNSCGVAKQNIKRWLKGVLGLLLGERLFIWALGDSIKSFLGGSIFFSVSADGFQIFLS